MTLFGFVVAKKPPGITSRRVVDQVLRLVRPAKVGHAGTLDPLATGVLVIAIGQATRLVEYVHEWPKHYRGTFLLGRTSPTEDVDGQITLLPNAPQPTLEQVQAAAAELVGESLQRPPAFSALKVDGQRAYKLARAGEAVDLVPRTVRIDRLEVVEYSYPQLTIEVTCSAGTYVRSLGRDLADKLGTGAVMSALERTAIGPFTLDAAVDVAKLDRGEIDSVVLSPLVAIDGLMPRRTLTVSEVERLKHGLAIELPETVADGSDQPATDRLAAVDETGRLIAVLARRAAVVFSPTKFFPAS